MTNQLKHGEVLERMVRRNRIGISELSRRLNVSRRTIYNWFGQDRLSHEVIWQVGNLVGDDLSVSFPDLFPNGYLENFGNRETAKESSAEANSVYFWMNKYIQLLEKYNELLSIDGQQTLEEQPAKPQSLRNRRSESFLYQ